MKHNLLLMIHEDQYRGPQLIKRRSTLVKEQVKQITEALRPATQSEKPKE